MRERIHTQDRFGPLTRATFRSGHVSNKGQSAGRIRGHHGHGSHPKNWMTLAQVNHIAHPVQQRRLLSQLGFDIRRLIVIDQ